MGNSLLPGNSLNSGGRQSGLISFFNLNVSPNSQPNRGARRINKIMIIDAL